MSWLHLDVRSAAISAVALFAVVIGLRPIRRRWARFIAAAAYETALICGLFALWQLANRTTHIAHSGGISHGRTIWHFERWLHLPSETSLQHQILGHHWLVRSSNYYYATAHLTGMVIFLVWLWLRHRDRYRPWRNIVVIFTGISLLIETIPVAPPRLIGGTGLVDTAMVYGQSVYAFIGSNLADQYAALPSIHVGWALLIALAVWRCSSGPWRAVGIVHAALTMFVVVATANHYWLDGVAAAVVLAFAVGLERLRAELAVRSSRARSPRADLVSSRCCTYPATSGRATADK